jgi:hypothetical protein
MYDVSMPTPAPCAGTMVLAASVGPWNKNSASAGNEGSEGAGCFYLLVIVRLDARPELTTMTLGIADMARRLHNYPAGGRRGMPPLPSLC